MKAETQIRALVRHISPLAKCLKDYRPCAQNIHIRRDDWKMLHDNPDLAKTSGFILQEDGGVSYEGFNLVAIDTHKRRDYPEET